MPWFRYPVAVLLVAALAYTLVNATKPLTIDDTAYYYFARQAAQHPLDPYGFAIFWWEQPEEANYVLAPPLLGYWWAASLRLFGDSPFLWKMGLFPFSALLVLALHALARRLVKGLEVPLVVMTIFSPTFLPSLNLMLDVPALALSLSALALFARSVDDGSFVRAAGAGVLAALAMETKYTGVLAPAAMLLYAACFGGLRFWGVAALVAAQCFVAWEWLMSLLYGEAHFLLHARANVNASLLHLQFLRPMLSILGSVGWPVTLLALAGMGVRRVGLFVAAAAWVAAHLLIALWGGTLKLNENLFGPFRAPEANKLLFEQLVFGLFGIAALGIAGGALYRLWRFAVPEVLPSEGYLPRGLSALRSALSPDGPWRVDAASWFVGLWLLLELLGYVALTPFPAVRRVLGVVVAGTFTAGRLAVLRSRSSAEKRVIHAIAAFSALAGLGYFAVDWIDSSAQRDAALQAAQHIREHDPEGRIWYVGHWGFQFYAEQAGLEPVVPAEPFAGSLVPMPGRSLFQSGDWLVLPTRQIVQQKFQRDKERTEYVFSVIVSDRIPWRTIPCFYGGHTGIEHHTGPRVEVDVYRVIAPHRARAPATSSP